MSKSVKPAPKGRGSATRRASKPFSMVKPHKVEKLNLGPNQAVAFDMWKFINMLFVQTLKVGAYFKGPGPLKISWGFEYLDEAVGHSDDMRTYDVQYQRLYAIKYLADQILTKYDDGRSDDQKRKKAEERFAEAEKLCALANRRFAHELSAPVWAHPRRKTGYMCPETGRVFSHECLVAARTAKKLLAKLFKYDEDLVGRHMYFSDHGPGATTRLPRKDAHQTSKWGGRPHVTANAVTFGDRFLQENPGYAAAGAQWFIFPGNFVTWVNKNYLTLRTIAMEPEVNMLYQQSIRHYMDDRLKTVGIDLTDQSRNADAAKRACFDDLSTEDFSMASDTVGVNPSKFYFPSWLFEHLMAARSPVGLIVEDGRDPLFQPDGSGGFVLANGRSITYEKLSSMGNAATFPVESALFWAFATACCEVVGSESTEVFVFGDDVVLPRSAAQLFNELAEFSGFVVNHDKTHIDGPFHESCGGHYWCGTDVTPFYIREDVAYLDRLFLLHNNLYRWFARNPDICDKTDARTLLAWVRSHAPEAWRRPRLHSLTAGDGAFVGKPTIGSEPKQFWDMTREVATTRRFQGWEGHGVNVMLYISKSDAKLDSFDHDDRKAVFAGIWKGCRYEFLQGDQPHIPEPSKASGYSDVPWKMRYWSVGIQVYPKCDVISWL